MYRHILALLPVFEENAASHGVALKSKEGNWTPRFMAAVAGIKEDSNFLENEVFYCGVSV